MIDRSSQSHGLPITGDLLRRVAFCASILFCAIAHAGDPLRVHLHDAEVSADGLIRLHDIAHVSGSSPDAVTRLGDVDIGVVTYNRARDLIDRDRVAARLLLAGYDGRDVVITGPSVVSVRFRTDAAMVQELDAASVEAAARAALAKAFSVEPEDVEARLTTPLNLSLTDAVGPLKVDVIVPVNPQPGHMRLAMRIFAGSDLLHVTNGLFDVRVRQQIVLASATLPVGTVLNAANVTYQDRWATRREYVPPRQTLQQWRVRRAIQAGETISSDDLIPVAPEEENPVVIRPRDVVQLVARGKGITATVPGAEALEAGRVGDRIRVRNMHSRRVVVGEVLSSEEVQVRF